MSTAVSDEPPGAAAPGRSIPKPAVVNPSLAEVLDNHTVAGSLWRAEGERLRCVACGHRCLIAPGRRGICKVRFNRGGELRVPFGYAAGVQSDPVEKKPFYHVHPGSDALTFGMLGCDFHCSYCQNWVTSQALRDPAAGVPVQVMSARQLVQAGQRRGARLAVSSYNEPLITAEWAVAVFQEARAAGMTCAFVSNGNATPEALDFLQPWVAAYKVDLKGFNDQRYRTLGGTLDRVTWTIRALHERGIWCEVVTLLVPGFNDDPGELRDLTQFLVSVSPYVPWHVTAFHADFKMAAPGTSATQLIAAAEIGTAAGLKFVYAGNAPGRVDPWENTYCPGCDKLLIGRTGFRITEHHINTEGCCPACKTLIPGVGLGEPVPGPAATGARFPRPVRV